jgi:membrane-bound lytic murein transglycosylase D
LPAYNCGKNNIERAIDRGRRLPIFGRFANTCLQETRGYVPAYIAVSYIMNYAKQHNIIPQAANFNIKTDTLMVNKMVSLSNVAKLLELDMRELVTLNPSYKRGIVNGTATSARRLILPQIPSAKFAAIYNVIDGDGAVATAPVAYAANTAPAADYRPAKRPAYHKVRKGETLADIADQYGVEVQDLKAWNNLHSSKATVGLKLKLNETTAATDDSPVSKKSAAKYLTYKVRKGDTLSGLAEKFEASVDSIKELNGLKKNALQPGMTLKITKV